ncbi:YihY/virulence factor BrkB family protein [Demequina sp. B12]|uniref:YihY/virulence factor BrkB family protein n=1 Tax=Demequina sp. B12 TaxID=2992757 RepID=UPI00237A4240|nr:YhjD/YihY/BrkB family envelope integrity protein [Demequina sp. B12]MDE0572647.1 YihY/virulence factor BrkB family protein [Demequina sp. B12]
MSERDPQPAADASDKDDASALQRGKEALAETGAVEGAKAAIETAKSRKEWFDNTHPGRTLERIKEGNAMLLAGGIAYFSLTSLAAAVVIGVTLSSFLVRYNAAWNEAFYGFLDDVLPGIVGTGDDALINPEELDPQTLTGVVGVVSFLVLFNTATRYLRGNRIGVRIMLGKAAAPPAKGKMRDFIALFSLFLVVVLGVGLQVLASRFSVTVASWFDQEWISEGVIRTPAIVVGGFLDMAFVGLIIVVLGRYRGPKKSLLWVLLVSAVAIGVLRQAVSLIIATVSDNPVLAPFAAIVTVMIFADFIARIIMVGAAWLGTDFDVQEQDPELEVEEMDSPARREHGSVTTTRATQRSDSA